MDSSPSSSVAKRREADVSARSSSTASVRAHAGSLSSDQHSLPKTCYTCSIIFYETIICVQASRNRTGLVRVLPLCTRRAHTVQDKVEHHPRLRPWTRRAGCSRPTTWTLRSPHSPAPSSGACAAAPPRPSLLSLSPSLFIRFFFCFVSFWWVLVVADHGDGVGVADGAHGARRARAAADPAGSAGWCCRCHVYWCVLSPGSLANKKREGEEEEEDEEEEEEEKEEEEEGISGGIRMKNISKKGLSIDKRAEREREREM